MNDKALVQRLRNLAEEWFEMCDDIHEPLSEAATRIEALEAEKAQAAKAERDRLRELPDELVAKLSVAAFNNWGLLISDIRAVATALADALESQP